MNNRLQRLAGSIEMILTVGDEDEDADEEEDNDIDDDKMFEGISAAGRNKGNWRRLDFKIRSFFFFMKIYLPLVSYELWFQFYI